MVTAPTESRTSRPLGAPWAAQFHLEPSHQFTYSFESYPWTKAYGRSAAFGSFWTLTTPAPFFTGCPDGAPWSLQCHLEPSHQLTQTRESSVMTKAYGRVKAFGLSRMVVTPRGRETMRLGGVPWSLQCHFDPSHQLTHSRKSSVITKAYGRCAAFASFWTLTTPTPSRIRRLSGAPCSLHCHLEPSHQFTYSFESSVMTNAYGRCAAVGLS